MGTYQHILALLVIALGVVDYLIIIFLVVIVVTVIVLPSLPCQQFPYLFFLSSSFAFLCRSASAWLATIMDGSFGSRAG